MTCTIGSFGFAYKQFPLASESEKYISYFFIQSRIIWMSLFISREWSFFLKKSHFQEPIWILRQMCSLKLRMAGIFLAALFYLHVEITRSYNKVSSFYSLVEILLKDFKCSYQKASRWHSRLTQNSPTEASTPSPGTQALRLYFFKNKSLTYSF